MSAPRTVIEPRKRPRQARSAVTVDAIVEAAARILTADGLAGLNTNAVAERAGVSVGSLYQYFPGKEAILTEMLRRKRRKLLDDMTAALAGMEREDEDTVIARLVAAAMRNQARAPRLAQALDYASAALPLHDETMHTNRRVIETVARALALHAVPDAQQAARDVVGLTRGMMLQAFHEGTADETALARRICLAIRGYLAELRREAG
ncbi:TetR/AcrR family transcriptional regulator [Arhodomonas sp. AD133]|uniref:TetR/AcrR family transcriptional regulator n=1 Tax=Arhodomonas sp. AD133 TaxID=3415009 RepID=UPI003EBF2111